MIAQTSKLAYQPETRAPQRNDVFLELQKHAHMGTGATARQIADALKIDRTSVHGRICEIKNGHEYDGVTYYAVALDRVKYNGRLVQRFTLTTENLKADTTLAEIDQIKAQALKDLRRWRIERERYINKQVKNLFDK